MDHIYLAGDRADVRARDLETLAAREGIVVHKVDRARLDRITKGDARHQGVVAFVFPAPQAQDVAELIADAKAKGEAPLFLILDGITDPHNFGACVRSADAFGCHGVIVPKDKSAPLNEVAAKAASGALETLPVLAVTNLARAIDELKAEGVWIYGTADGATETLQNVPSAQFRGAMAWALGAEGSGLRRLTQEKCDVLLRIPMMGSVESLNVSVATGVCLYSTHAARIASKAG